MLTSSGTTKRLDRLEQAGLITRAPDPEDRRATLITLTGPATSSSTPSPKRTSTTSATCSARSRPTSAAASPTSCASSSSACRRSEARGRPAQIVASARPSTGIRHSVAYAADTDGMEPTVLRPRFGRPRLAVGGAESELLARVRSGDDSAFEALYDAYHRRLLAFCQHMLGSREEAEDVLQHTFLAAYRSLRVGLRGRRPQALALHDRAQPLPLGDARAPRGGRARRRRARHRGARGGGRPARGPAHARARRAAPSRPISARRSSCSRSATTRTRRSRPSWA